MRVLHTSDWHLGLNSGRVSRLEDHARYLKWLIEFLKREKIDALVVAGDVFESMQPSNEALKLYYSFLTQVSQSDLGQVVIVGGNHDSSAVLDAPKSVLDLLSVYVVGGLPPQADEQIDSLIVPLRSRHQHGALLPPPEVVCVALPYIHEYRLGVRTTDDDQKAVRAELVRRFSELYSRCAARAAELYPGLPLIATGHLTVGKSSDADYPRPIHAVGTLDALPASIFDARFSYVALGHIHSLRAVESGRVYYSGTPVATHFAEAKTQRRMILLEFSPEQGGQETGPIKGSPNGASPQIREIRVPQPRALVSISGERLEVFEQLRQWQSSGQLPGTQQEISAGAQETQVDLEPLRPLLSLKIGLSSPEPGLSEKLEAELALFAEGSRPLLVELKEYLISTPEALEQGGQPGLTLTDYSPAEVFGKLLLSKGEQEKEQLLLNAFASLQSVSKEEHQARVGFISSRDYAAEISATASSASLFASSKEDKS